MSVGDKKAGVIGAGTMGTAIAQNFARFGYHVELVDIDEDRLDLALTEIRTSLIKLASIGVIDPAKLDPILSRINPRTEIRELPALPLVLESVSENFQLKQEVFRVLDELMPPETILASNSSSISITEIGACTNRADRVIGMHFLSPVPHVNLLEVIRAVATSDETFNRVESIARDLGKRPVDVQDYPGFVANRILMPMINEAIYALMEGVASADDIDTVMKHGMSHPTGPLHLADFIGLDKCLSIMEILFEGFSDPKYRPCPLLKKMVNAGYLGRKSGRGFFNYES